MLRAVRIFTQGPQRKPADLSSAIVFALGRHCLSCDAAGAVASGTLPHAVIVAATSGDASTISSWIADDRCVVDAWCAMHCLCPTNPPPPARHQRQCPHPSRANTLFLSLHCLCHASSSSLDGCTALHAAARHGHVHLVRILLEAGADALAVNSEMRTPLHHVAAAGHGICVKALLDAGSDPEGEKYSIIR